MLEAIRVDNDIVLSPLALDDGEEFAALSRAEAERLRRWLPYFAQVNTVELFTGYFESVRDLCARGLWIEFAVRVGGSFGGVVQIHHIDPYNRLGDVAYWIDAKLSGQKVLTRVLPVLVDVGFRKRRLHRLQLITDVENVASRVVAERCGFSYEATLRDRFAKFRAYSDGIMYVKLREA